MRPAIICCCLLTITLLPTPAAPPEHVKASDIHPERELLITDPVILDSAYAQYPGPWSFGALVEEIFGKEKAPEAIHRWLLCYAEESTTGAAPECLSPADFGAPLPAESKSAITRIKKGRSDSGSDDQPAIKIPPRSDIARKFVHDWQQCDGYNPASGLPWEPNLAHAPFRLLAIVNRMDLGVAPLVDTEGDLRTKWTNTGKERQLAAMIGLSTQGVHGITTFPSDQPASLSPYGGFGGLSRGNIAAASPRGFRGFRNLSSFTSTCVTPPPPNSESKGPNFGEGRLVFGAVGPDGQPLPGGWTLIFEYKLEPLSKVGHTFPSSVPGSLTAQNWAQAWHWLGGLELKDPRFADSLVAITKAFTHRQPNDKGEIPDNAKTSFSQLRSSEAAFGSGREFRQFDLKGDAFVPALLPLTPAPAFLDDRQVNGRVLGTFLNEIEPLIRAGVHSIPKTIENRRTTFALQGATALIPEGEKDFHWDPAPHVSRDARRIFSMNTCNGCHAGDTGCSDGLHVHPRWPGMEAKVSAFLRRDGQPDKFQDPGLKTSYVRLTEMEDRAAILAALLEPKEKKRLDQLEDLLRARLRRSH